MVAAELVSSSSVSKWLHKLSYMEKLKVQTRPALRKIWPVFVLLASDKEKPVGKSETIPDQSISVKELLLKFTQGIEPVGRNPVYMSEDMSLDDVDLSKVGQYDLFDKDQLLVELKQRVLDSRKKLREAQEGKEGNQEGAPVTSKKSKSSSYKYDDDASARKKGAPKSDDAAKRKDDQVGDKRGTSAKPPRED